MVLFTRRRRRGSAGSRWKLYPSLSRPCDQLPDPDCDLLGQRKCYRIDLERTGAVAAHSTDLAVQGPEYGDRPYRNTGTSGIFPRPPVGGKQDSETFSQKEPMM